jgi:hypothetical protein
LKEEKAMQKFLSLMTVLALVALALPLSAQEAGGGGQQDTAMAGRMGEGLAPGEQPGQPRTPEAGGVTTREGIEGQEAGAGQDTAGMAGAETTEPGAETTETGGEMGGEMPTTGSPLPLVAAVAGALVALGLGVRFLTNRS